MGLLGLLVAVLLSPLLVAFSFVELVHTAAVAVGIGSVGGVVQKRLALGGFFVGATCRTLHCPHEQQGAHGGVLCKRPAEVKKSRRCTLRTMGTDGTPK